MTERQSRDGNGRSRPALQILRATGGDFTEAELPAGACAHAVVRLNTSGDHAAWWSCRDCGTPFAPAGLATDHPAHGDADRSAEPEYVSIRDLTKRIPYSEGTIRNMMSRGTLRLGEHYVKPNGRVMFKWSAVNAWLNEQR